VSPPHARVGVPYPTGQDFAEPLRLRTSVGRNETGVSLSVAPPKDRGAVLQIDGADDPPLPPRARFLCQMIVFHGVLMVTDARRPQA
jgi:hypothetical protein